jgi:hypothetical protein
LDSIIDDVTNRFSELLTLSEEDFEEFVPDVMSHFSGLIHNLAGYVYGTGEGVALGAFKEYSSQTIKKGLYSFIVKNQHWRSGRTIEPYLIKCLRKLADKLKSDISFVKKLHIPICPACRTLNQREFLVYDGKKLRCPSCTKEADRLDSIENKTSHEEYCYRLRKIFALHSRKGCRCPSCHRFIPMSYVGPDAVRVSCPYDNCLWFGLASELEIMPHPLGQGHNNTVSLHSELQSDKVHSTVFKPVSIQDTVDSREALADSKIECSQEFDKEYEIVKNVIATQKQRVKDKSLKKSLMYRAFELLFEEDPAGLISYLINGRSNGERPILSAIFQKYVQLMENNLPVLVDTEEGGTKEIYSISDPDLELFLGVSEFQTFVRAGNGNIIPNKTHEVFAGTKCHGPCFIGFLCDVVDVNTGKSLMDQVDYYTFAHIRMKSVVPVNTMVKVTHLRIPPHYEMFSLVLLQRTRRKIVESVNRRLDQNQLIARVS